jgi:hypothetical protein
LGFGKNTPEEIYNCPHIPHKNPGITSASAVHITAINDAFHGGIVRAWGAYALFGIISGGMLTLFCLVRCQPELYSTSTTNYASKMLSCR